ncbi:Structural maintenance of chromosomes protein 6, partial [Stegodyphus mimosarum]
MDIHVDNPTTVLTQDMSRTFLISKNADKKKLYKLFYEGTGLQKIQENYAKVTQLKEAAVLNLETKKKLLQETEKELLQWEKLMNHAKTCSDLENELLWAIAIEIEKKLLDEQQKFEEAQNEIIKIQKEKEITQAEHFQLSENFKSRVMDQQNLEKEIESIKSTLKELKSQKQSVTKDIREHVGLLDRYKRENDRLDNDIMQAENALNEAKNKDAADAEQREHDKEIQRLEAELSGIKSELNEKTKAWGFYLDEENDLEKICGSLITEKEEELKRKLSIEKELKQLKFSMSNKERDFGPEMQNAVRSISCCNDFIKPPKGPIGQYLEVLDQEWSFAVECCLSEKILRAFICDNCEDEKQLHRILSEHFNQSNMPRIFRSKYLPAMYNVESFKAVSSYPTVLDKLKIKDPVVANCLIDMIKIESIILIDEFDAAIELMMNAPPKYCHSAYLKNGDQIFPKFSRYYSCPKKLSLGILNPFCEKDIREKEGELQSINVVIGSKAERIRLLNEHRKKSSAERKSLDEASVDLEIRIVELNEELEAKRKIEKPRDKSELKSDLDHLNEEKEKMEDKIKNCEAQLSNQEAELQIINSKMDKENDLLLKKQKENQSLKSEIQECTKKLNCLQTSISRYEKSFKTLEGKARNHEEALPKAKEAAEVAVRNAEKFSARINTERSSTTIKKVLNETKKVLEQVSNCEMENLKRRYQEKTAKLEHAKSELERIESYVIKINEMMEKRSKKFENILKNTKLCLCLRFITYLNTSGFVGDLIFDDKQQ